MSINKPFIPLSIKSSKQNPSKNAHLVFVYGTLRRNYHNHKLISKAYFISEWVTPAQYTMISFGFYPAVIAVGTSPIVGELYKINDKQLEEVDQIEGVPTFYQRDTIETPAGKAIWYVMPESAERTDVVFSGDWDEHVLKGRAPNA